MVMRIILNKFIELVEAKAIDVRLHLPRRDVDRHRVVLAALENVGRDERLRNELLLVHGEDLE